MKTMYAHRQEALETISSYRKEGLSLRVIARRLSSAGYVNMKGYRVTTSDVNNFLVKVRKTGYGFQTETGKTPSPLETDLRGILAANFSTEAKLKFISALVG